MPVTFSQTLPTAKSISQSISQCKPSKGFEDKKVEQEAVKLPPPEQSETEIFDMFSSPEQVDVAELFALPSQPAPALKRPVLMVHGFNSNPSVWKNMRTWFTSNSQNVDGGIVSSNAATDPLKTDGKVFVMEFTRPFNSVMTNAAELRRAVDRIVAATGAKDIDLVGHSMGGLDARAYLDAGNEHVAKVVQIGTPNHGSLLADIELQFREFGMPLFPKTDDPEVRQTLTDLRAERKIDGQQANPTVAALNKNWGRQKDRADFLLMAGVGKPTLKQRTLLTFKGDGVVPKDSAKMPDVPLVTISSTKHGALPGHPDVLTNTANFLVGKAIEIKAEPTTPEDKEIVPVMVAGNTGQVQYSYKDKKDVH